MPFEEIIEGTRVVNRSVAAENLNFDRASIEEFDLPSLAGNCNFHHDRVVAILV